MFIENIKDQSIFKASNLLENNLNKNKENKKFFNCFQTAINNAHNIEKNVKKNYSNISLNDAMINLQKASISIELAIQIRNKIVSAYKEIMNQQI